MRRALAAALLGISLLIGALAWSGFLMLQTVLDPDRSEAVANTLLDDPDVRDQLVENMADAAEAALPAGAPVQRAQLEVAAEEALASPEVEALIRGAFVETHRAFLGEGDVPQSVDGAAFGSAAREQLVDDRPELGGVLPAAPELAVELPTERVPDLGPVRRGLQTAVPLLAGVAAFGVILSLVVTTNRPAILRRAGVWAIVLSAFVLLFAFGVPAFAREFAPDQAEVVAALVGALAASSRGPALVLAAAGLGGVLASFVWKPAASALAPEPVPAPRRRARGAPQRHPRQPRTRRTRAGGPPARAPRPPSHPARSPRPVAPPPPQAPPPTGPPRPPRGDEPTRVQGAPAPDPPARSRPGPGSGATQPEGRRWVAGVGWVVEGPGEIPEDARWVAGVGYVIDP
ncbi:MAG: hypothetical protein U5K30_07470 [Acidimicrobiales bacterium]|nr:hypothetical protein [Acidimicrobiales bacterium]